MPPEDPPVPPVDPTPNDPPKDPKVFDEEYVRGLRSEAAANRKKAEALEAKLKERDDADLSETDRLKKAAQEATDKLTATETRARERLAKAEVKTAAVAANIIDPDTAFVLLRDKIEFDDDGEPKDVAKLIEALAKEKPYLVKQDIPPSGNPGNPAGGRGGGGVKLDPKNPPSWGSIYRK